MADLTITWYGHGTFRIKTPGGKSLLVDPYLDGNPACPPEMRNDRKFDLLLVTHGHADHFGDTFNILRQSKASVACIYEMAHYILSKGIEHERVIGFNIGGSIEFDGIVITMTNALHSGVLFEGTHPINVGPPVGFMIHLEDDRKLYCAGDTDIFSEMELLGEFYNPFAALLPIDGYYNMNPRSAARAVQFLKCEHVIPIHHSTFPILWGRPDMLQAELGKLGLDKVVVHKMNPGEKLTL